MFQVVVESVGLSDFLVQIGSCQDSLVILLLFIIVLETLSREIRSRCPEELLYVDELAFVNVTLKCLKGRVAWRKALESKRLRVKVKKRRIVISSENVGKVTAGGKFPCVLCKKGVCSNSILFQFCRCWVHK